MFGSAEIRIVGKEEVEAAFFALDRNVNRGLRPALAEAAEPIRSDAEERAVRNISRIGPRWSRMRVGLTLKSVYVAPKSRRRRGSPRRNLAPLLLNKAMQPALDAHAAEVYEKVDIMVDAAAVEAGW